MIDTGCTAEARLLVPALAAPPTRFGRNVRFGTNKQVLIKDGVEET